MSCFHCPHCGEKSYIFGCGGAQRTAQEMDMEFLGEVYYSSYSLVTYRVCILDSRECSFLAQFAS